MKLKTIFAILLIGVITLGCNFSNRISELSTENGKNSITVEQGKPTPTAEIDLSSAGLTLDDLPAGFQTVDEADLRLLGFSKESILKGFSDILSKATAQNFVVFLNPTQTQIIVSSVIYPLTFLEEKSLDILLSNPDQLSSLIPVSAGATNLQVIQGLEDIGDKAGGLSFTTSTDQILWTNDILLVRRNAAIALTYTLSPAGIQPSISAIQLATLLDSRIDQAYQ